MPETLTDWIGTIITVVAFLGMSITLYFLYRPKGDKIEKQKNIPLQED